MNWIIINNDLKIRLLNNEDLAIIKNNSQEYYIKKDNLERILNLKNNRLELENGLHFSGAKEYLLIREYDDTLEIIWLHTKYEYSKYHGYIKKLFDIKLNLSDKIKLYQFL